MHWSFFHYLFPHRKDIETYLQICIQADSCSLSLKIREKNGDMETVSRIETNFKFALIGVKCADVLFAIKSLIQRGVSF